MRRVAVLGATGSIGRQTLDVIASHPDRLRLVGMAAGSRWHELVEAARRMRPEVVALVDTEAAAEAARALSGEPVRVLAGAEGVEAVAAWPDADTVVAAITGTAGLLPTLRAVEMGKRVGLANKEALVVAGPVVKAAAAASGAELLPVDSEHAAIWQALEGRPAQSVRRLLLTASGGPFRGRTAAELREVTPADALRHPTWEMGPRITVDSATLMNKGFEVIEAHHLFGQPPERIEVVVHPQSVVHSLVEFVDGSLLGQFAVPDMRLPIQYALSYPERWHLNGDTAALDLARLGSLTFEAPDRAVFPCLDLAYAAAAMGGTTPAVLNAADEVAVARFLTREIGFADIPRLVDSVLERHRPTLRPDLEAVLAADAWGRRAAAGWRPRR